MIELIKVRIKNQIKKSGRTSDQVCRSLKEGRKYISNMTEEVKLNKILRICKEIGCEPGDILNDL